MEITTKLCAIVIAVTSLALAPSLIVINSADAATHYCTDHKGKSQNWINGCKKDGQIIIIVTNMIRMGNRTHFIVDIKLDGKKVTVSNK